MFYVASNDGTIVNDVVAYLKVLFKRLCGRAEENYEQSRRRWPLCGW